MNDKELSNIKNIISTGKHFCIHTFQSLDLIKSALLEDTVQNYGDMNQGHVVTFTTGSQCFINIKMPPGHISLFLSKGFPKNQKDKNWSIPVPIELLESEELLDRILKLKSFLKF